MKFSVRSLLFITAAIALLLALALEYGMIIRADGGGDQLIKITSIPSATKSIDLSQFTLRNHMKMLQMRSRLEIGLIFSKLLIQYKFCLLYTSDAADE